MSLFASTRGIRLPKSDPPPGLRITELPPPGQVVLPMRQTLGHPAHPAVKLGDEVRRGQAVGEPADPIGVPILASTSGKVVAVEDRPGPEGRAELSVVIEADGADAWVDEPVLDEGALELDPREMLERIRRAGVIDSGFGAEPSHRDLGTAIDPRGYVGVSGEPVTRSVEHLIVRAVDVDPAAYTLEAVLADGIAPARRGFEVLKRILDASAIHLVLTRARGRGLNMHAIEQFCEPMEIWPVPVDPCAYPSVNDNVLIQSITGMEVGGAFREPRDMGVVVENIDTVVAVGAAVTENRPQTDRVVWVSGRVRHPKLLRVRIGTPLRDVIAACGGFAGTPGAVLLGGPMRGRAEHDLDAPVTRLSGMVTVLGEDELVEFTNEPCMNCGACVRVCPMRLMPNTLSRLCEYGQYDEALNFDLLTCIECGCCTYVCPSMRANGHYLLHGKTEVMARRRRT